LNCPKKIPLFSLLSFTGSTLDESPVLKGDSDSDVLLVEIYLLGQRRLSIELKNYVIDELRRSWIDGHKLPAAEVVELVFAESMAKSKIRQLAVDTFAWESETDALRRCRG
jgi:hypothetical protein